MHQKISSEWQLQPLEEWSGNKSPLSSALLGVLACSGTVMILLHGVGLGPWSSAAVLIGPISVLIALGRFRNTVWDSSFALFVVWLGISTAVNGPGPLKEEALLILTLAAYPAARLSGVAGRGMFVVLGIVGCLGLSSIISALQAQWGDPHGKPLVFGLFDAAPAQVFICFALLLMGMVANHLERRWLVIGYSIAGAAFVVLAASLVRFSFLALVCVLLCEAATSRRTRGKAIIAAIMVLAALPVGYYTRIHTAERLTAAMADQVPNTANPCGVNEYSSISMRQRLVKDAIVALPRAGLFGHGLSSFTAMTCLGIESHISLVQLVIEYGWPAGLLFLCIALGGLTVVFRMERAEARFAFMGFLFAATLSLAHGDLARDGLVFLFLGHLVRISEPQP